MKFVFGSNIVLISLASMVGVVKVFIKIDNSVKSNSGLNQQQNDKTVLGHRIDGQGQFVLVYK